MTIKITITNKLLEQKLAETAKKKAGVGEAVVDAALFGGCVAEDAASLAEGADAALQIGGGVFLAAIDSLFFGGLLLAGRREIASVEAKIARRVERINKKLPEGRKLPVLNFGRSSVNQRPVKSAKADKISAIASGASVAATADGFAAKPFSFMTNIIGVLVYPIALVCAGIAGFFARRRAKRYEELQVIAKSLKELEEQIEGNKTQLPLAETDETRLDAFDANWEILSAYQRKILALEKTSKKEKLAALAVAGVFAIITGATIYAACSSIATTSTLGVVAAVPVLSTAFSYMVTGTILFMAICPPLLLVCAIAAIALHVGAMIYKNIADKMNTATHHCMNKVRRFLGLASIDGVQHGFSATTKIRMIGAALSVVAFVTIPIIGWIAGLVAAAVLGTITAAASAYISHKEAERKNLVKDTKGIRKPPETVSGSTESTAATVIKTSGTAASPVATASIAKHVEAQRSFSSDIKKRIGFFNPPSSTAATETNGQRLSALGC